MNRKLFTLLFCLAFGLTTIAGQTRPEGGTLLTMSHSAIAGGGGYSQWTQPDVQSIVPNFEVTGTIGQAVVGPASTGDQYRLHHGFWFPDDLQPSAAPASISGRVNNLESFPTTARRVQLVLTNLSSGEVRIAPVNQFGFYEFTELELTSLYMVKAEGPSMVFEPESVTIRLVDNITGVDFSAIPAQ